jgi:dTDP-4-amino-4,6-dideoxygalactose transaminase
MGTPNDFLPFLPFARPSIDQATIDEVADCLRSGWLATGPRVQKFTEALKQYLSAPHVLPLTSATAGLHLALLGLNFKPGDEVITPALSFVATANTIVQAGATPVFVDIEPGTYNLDLKKTAAAITSKTRAIVPVHYAGLPVDLDALYALAKKHSLRIIEDAAHAIGTDYKGRKIGSFGDTQVFSFHPNKNMTTGEGGCVVTRDETLAQFVSMMGFHGINRNDAWNRFSKQGSQHYDVVAPGFKYNMMDIQAAIGLHQLASLDEFIEKRTKLALRYFDLFENWREWELPKMPAHYAYKHSWHLFLPLLNPDVAKISRDDFMAAMKELNIGIGFHYDVIHLFSYYRERFGYKPGDFPVAENVASRIVSLPLFPSLTEKDQDRVISAMKQVFHHLR